jgi:hypothetical protein
MQSPFSQSSLGGFIALEDLVLKVQTTCQMKSSTELSLVKCVQHVRDRTWKDIKSAVAKFVRFTFWCSLLIHTSRCIETSTLAPNACVGQQRKHPLTYQNTAVSITRS